MFFPKHNIVREVYNGNLLPAFPCVQQDGEHAGGHCPGCMDQGLSDTDHSLYVYRTVQLNV